MFSKSDNKPIWARGGKLSIDFDIPSIHMKYLTARTNPITTLKVKMSNTMQNTIHFRPGSNFPLDEVQKFLADNDLILKDEESLKFFRQVYNEYMQGHLDKVILAVFQTTEDLMEKLGKLHAADLGPDWKTIIDSIEWAYARGGNKKEIAATLASDFDKKFSKYFEAGYASVMKKQDQISEASIRIHR